MRPSSHPSPGQTQSPRASCFGLPSDLGFWSSDFTSASRIRPSSSVAPKRVLKPHPSHLQAIYLGVASHPHATPMRPSCVHHATLMRPRSHPKAGKDLTSRQRRPSVTMRAHEATYADPTPLSNEPGMDSGCRPGPVGRGGREGGGAQARYSLSHAGPDARGLPVGARASGGSHAASGQTGPGRGAVPPGATRPARPASRRGMRC